MLRIKVPENCILKLPKDFAGENILILKDEKSKNIKKWLKFIKVIEENEQRNIQKSPEEILKYLHMERERI